MLSHYKELLRHFWRVILLGAVGAGLTALALSLLLLKASPIYESSVVLNMQPSDEELQFNRGFMGVSQFNPATIIAQTHIERLTSRPVAERAIDILLAEAGGALPSEPPTAFDRFRAWFFRTWNMLNYGYYIPPTERQVLISDMLKAINIEIVEGSYILLIEISHSHPEVAARAADALARAYVEVTQESFIADAADVDASIKRVMDATERDLAQALAQQRDIMRTLGVSNVDAERDILLETRREARQNLLDAQVNLKLLTAQEESLVSSISRETDSSAVQQLRLELTETRASRAQAGARIELRAASLEEIDEGLVALNRAEEALEETNQRITGIRTDLEELQSRRIKIELAREARMSQVRTISDAQVPAYPKFPKVFVNTVIAVFLGAMLTLIPISATDVLDGRVRTIEDLNQALGQRVLPTASRSIIRKARRFLKTGRKPSGKMERFAQSMGRRFITDGARSWPSQRIFVTAFGQEDDVDRLRDVVDAVARISGPKTADGKPLEVVALPPMSKMTDWSAYRYRHLVVGVRVGDVDRSEVIAAGSATNDKGAGPFLMMVH